MTAVRPPGGREIADRALSAAGGSPDLVGDLVTMAEGHRHALEDARRLLVDRLHRRSDDFAATKALTAVAAALSRIGWGIPYVQIAAPRRGLRA